VAKAPTDKRMIRSTANATPQRVTRSTANASPVDIAKNKQKSPIQTKVKTLGVRRKLHVYIIVISMYHMFYTFMYM